MAPSAVSLFSGCGGTDLGIRELGFDIALANDVWSVAADLYRANLPDVSVQLGDVREVKSFPNADLLIGCYPCQGYSQGGTRNPASSLNYLYREFDRALRQISPKAFIVENVAGMAHANNRTLLNNQLVRFRLAGYTVSYNVLDAKDYGLAQTRRRLFIVGVKSTLGMRYEFPSPTHGPRAGLAYTSQQEVIGGMEEWPEGQYCSEPLHWYYMSRRRRHNWNEPSACIVGHWRHVPLHPISPPLIRIDTDHWQFQYPGPFRRLSLAECAALQSFPSDYRWESVRVKDGFMAAGNAVPPTIAKAIACALPDIW
ncbi:MAG: DNA (cytosine-5-)-methyltransferase [Chloroflexota bacterium]|nr:DNA (cytosine-5-)-methyltransferase [Chloroflexota bacterium]MDE2885132.1 DNA (cytosine-5-)-methyltransferase [Chloroflexota bacterium]